MLFRAKQAVAATMEKVGGGVHGGKRQRPTHQGVAIIKSGFY